jgi:hypothetical protein
MLVRLFLLSLVPAIAAINPVWAAWPPEAKTVSFTSPADGSEQKTLFYAPPGHDPVPLLVCFHTWSGDYSQNESPYAEWCVARGWAMLHPDLRGPAVHPAAAGSDAAYALRSVVGRLESFKPSFPLDINTGIHDGHIGSVPVSHAIRAFNAVAAESERIPVPVIEPLVKDRRVPAPLAFTGSDQLYATKPVLLRRQSGLARLTVFDGGHDILHEAALTWLEAQRKGAPGVWDPVPYEPPILAKPATAAGK